MSYLFSNLMSYLLKKKKKQQQQQKTLNIKHGLSNYL